VDDDEDEEAKQEEEEKKLLKAKADVGSAMNLLANTIVVAVTFYYVNAPSIQLRTLTWGMLDAAFSIVCAILMFEILKDMLYLIFKPRVNGFVTPNAIAAVLTLVIAQVLFFTFCKTEGTTDVRAVNGEMLTYNLQTVRSKAYGPTLARFYAFSWITFWASFQVQKGGSASKLLEWVPLMALGAGLLALLIVRIVQGFCTCRPSSKVRRNGGN
jgi:hypothetical protein